MKVEKTPEEAARSKRMHADSMIVMGAVTTLCGLAAAWIAISGRGDVPDWMFGGGRAARAVTGTWVNTRDAVNFADWGPEPFARAKKEGKLVLLFLGPSYSAPTARMEAETFGDLQTAALVNARFVPVRVKSEEYPDLDRRYRAGGWPTTAALLPDGVPLDAGTAMTPAVFQRWAGALADKAAAHPELLDRAEADAAARRAAAAAEAPSPAARDAASAASRARVMLLEQWDASRRTFDRQGPRFPRLERIAALRAIPEPWARELSLEAAKGALTFQDPKDGGFHRAANPDGTPAALEKVASDQAAALDALCGALPEAARGQLRFLDKSFTPKDPPAGWLGWQAGFALSEDRRAATDGPQFDSWRWNGWWPGGRGRLADDAELSRAVLDCAEASPAQKARARKVSDRTWDDFNKRVLKDPRLLLNDAVAVAGAMTAAGRTDHALSLWRWMDEFLSDGPAFYDRRATGVLPPEMDRLADPALNARALALARRLMSADRAGARAADVPRREKALRAWLALRSDSIDPAVWAALAGDPPSLRK
jgi:hypothetical protein